MSDLAPTAPAEPTALTPPQKAAVILSLLEPETARTLASRFDEGRTERAVEAFRSLRMVGRRQLAETVAAFLRELDGELPLIAGGERRAQDLLRALSPEEQDHGAAPAPSGSLAPGAEASAVWAYVASLEPEQVALLVAGERPAIIAAVMRQVDRPRAGAILSSLEPATAAEVIRIMMTGDQPARRTIDAVAEAIRRGAPLRLAATAQDDDRSSDVAGALNLIPARKQLAIMEPLREREPEAAGALEGKLVRFATLDERLPKTVAPMLFREVDNKIIDRALKHALSENPEVAEFLLASISQRLAEQIRGRVEEAGPVTAQEGEDAQTELLRILIKWSEEERFAFKAPPSEQAA